MRRHCLTDLRKQAGQAMIEYGIVLAFGVIILIQGGDNAPVKQLSKAIKDYNEHYGYAMAIAYIPDCDYTLAYDKSASMADIATLTGGIAVGVDRCIDWQNPKVPSLSVSGSMVFDMVPNVEDAIKKVIGDAVTDSINNFLNPASFMTKISFSPSDFF
jgi:Flp pilus assembly pilin Flp